MDFNLLGFPFLLIILIAFALSFLLTYTNKKIAIRFNIIDIPNLRSFHKTPTPRGGGMAIVTSFLTIFLIAGLFQSFKQSIFGGFLITCALIAILGFLDDLHDLSHKTRILAWIGITAAAIFFGIHLKSISLPLIGSIQFGFLSPLVTFIWLIGVTNFFNFMDGIDGLAGFEALLVSGFLAGISYQAGNEFVFTASVIIFAAALGFLPHNFPKARIFIGDGGSNFLGYIFAALSIIGSQDQNNTIPMIIPVILLLMFLLDASSTLIKRIPKGKEWLQPHREHLYQRLVKLGYSHLQVTLGYTIINLFLGIMAIQYFKSSGYWPLVYLGISMMPFLALAVFTAVKEKKKKAITDYPIV